MIDNGWSVEVEEVESQRGTTIVETKFKRV